MKELVLAEKKKKWVNTNISCGVETTFPVLFSPFKSQFVKEIALEIERTNGSITVLSPHS